VPNMAVFCSFIIIVIIVIIIIINCNWVVTHKKVISLTKTVAQK
jgi:hypothetical protein